MHLYFSYIVAVSFIGGGKRSTRRKPLTCCKSLTNLSRVHLAWAGFKLTTFMVIGTYCIGSCKSNYHTIMTVKYRYQRVKTLVILWTRNYLILIGSLLQIISHLGHLFVNNCNVVIENKIFNSLIQWNTKLVSFLLLKQLIDLHIVLIKQRSWQINKRRKNTVP
jgi:hypothetical protein